MQGLPRLTSGHALFLDFDGTLVDIAARPDAVRVADGLIATLAGLRQALGGALAIVTGRTLADIDRHLDPLRLVVASEHGAHCRCGDVDQDGGHPGRRAHRLAEAALRLQQAIGPYPRLLLEQKTSGLALHFRNAPQLEPLCSALMQELLGDMPGMELLRGKCVLELKPLDASKGQAVMDLMQLPPFRSRVPLFIGDDVTDEHAFSAAQRMGGFGVKVGGGKTLALLRCESPEEVREWLALQARALGAQANPCKAETP